MAERCTVSRDRVYEWALAGGGGRLAQHVAQCPHCQQYEREAQTALQEMRTVEPPRMTPRARDRLVQRAVTAASASDSPGPRRVRWRLAFLGGVAAVASFAAALWFLLPSGHMLARVSRGELATDGVRLGVGNTLAPGAPVVALEETEVQIASNSRATLRRGARARLLRRGHRASRWRLDGGGLRFSVDPADHLAVAVETEELTVHIVGTIFRVTREQERTTVDVERGTVRVELEDDGQPRLLRRGESLTWPALPVEEAAPADSPPTGLEEGRAGQRNAEQGNRRRLGPDTIRRHIRRGRLDEAGRLLRRARARADSAELALVAAELLLAEERFMPAVNAYLDVVARYSDTPQAEVALFAAGQLSIDHAANELAGRQLLHRYLKLYPRGRFVAQAQKLLADPL